MAGFLCGEIKGGETMTQKQRRFCDEYLIDCNATQAAIRAGYSKRTAYAIGEQNLKKLELKNYIDAKLEEISSQKTADAKEVVEYLTSVMRGEAKAEVVVVAGTGEGCSEARKIIKNPDEKEKLKAAELLGKYHGLYKEKVEHKASRVLLVDSVPEDW
jgi:phage terminase small subunit